MGERISNGRFTVSNDQDIVVFMVGVRVNKLKRIGTWRPVIQSIRPMLREAAADADSGMLGYRVLFAWPREVIVFQYWRGVDELLAFADRPIHRRAWQNFYRLATVDGAVGLWHEMYLIPAGRYEAIYGMVPPVGLASFSLRKPVGRRNDGARSRLRQPASPASASLDRDAT